MHTQEESEIQRVKMKSTGMYVVAILSAHFNFDCTSQFQLFTCLTFPSHPFSPNYAEGTFFHG